MSPTTTAAGVVPDVLRERVKGAVLEPGRPGYEEATQAFNTTVVQRPPIVVVPEDEDDVIAVVDVAREHGLQVAPQRTGHNAAPLEDLSGVVLLRTDALRGVEIDAERGVARVRAGSKWEDVVPRASELGFAALHGSTPDVSVAGYALGGGVGWYARRHGLAANSVTAIEVVTADGRLRRVDHAHEPELFWALRGGGGNFGVVTALEIRLLPVAEVYAGALFFPWERSAEVLHAWLDWTATLPEEVTSVGRVLRFPPLPEIPEPLRGGSFALVEAVVLGGREHGERLLAPLRALHPAMDTFDVVAPVGIAELHMDPPEPVPYAGGGQMLGALDHDAIDAFVALAGPGSDSPLLSAEIRHLGGALRRAPEGHGALATLDCEYMTFNVGMVLDDEGRAAIERRVGEMEAALAPYDAGREYLNFAEAPTDASRFFAPGAHRRLREARAAYDPAGVFRANHPIEPAEAALS
ncbi:MAG TPA: FAD-binding oxidoreductase [Solirubrobacteraceae bacterium]|nr:FAD-binding oxidoreductase [Solirubrobacteraceae bacterium]